MDERTDGLMGERTDGGVDGQVDGQAVGRTVRQTDGLTSLSLPSPSLPFTFLALP